MTTDRSPNAAAQSGRIAATLIPGDGIGPEITAAIVDILAAAGAPFDWDRQRGGLGAIATDGDRCRKRCSTASAVRVWR